MHFGSPLPHWETIFERPKIHSRNGSIFSTLPKTFFVILTLLLTLYILYKYVQYLRRVLVIVNFTLICDFLLNIFKDCFGDLRKSYTFALAKREEPPKSLRYGGVFLALKKKEFFEIFS